MVMPIHPVGATRHPAYRIPNIHKPLADLASAIHDGSPLQMKMDDENVQELGEHPSRYIQ
jgi:hypothetical protein